MRYSGINNYMNLPNTTKSLQLRQCGFSETCLKLGIRLKQTKPTSLYCSKLLKLKLFEKHFKVYIKTSHRKKHSWLSFRMLLVLIILLDLPLFLIRKIDLKKMWSKTFILHSTNIA